MNDDSIGICKDCNSFGRFFQGSGNTGIEVLSCAVAARDGYMSECTCYQKRDDEK